MAVTYVDLDDSYKVLSDNEPVNISVAIGDGQTGAYTIFLGKTLKGTNSSAQMGTKNDLVGQKATIVVTVADSLEETNWTSSTIQLQEGSNAQTFGPYKKQALNHVDTVIYTLQITFD